MVDVQPAGKKREEHLRVMTAPANNEEEGDTTFHCRAVDSMSRDAEMNVPPSMRTVLFT